MLYRLIDSNDLDEEDTKKIRDVEKRIFEEVVKAEIIKKKAGDVAGGWIGSSDQNRAADLGVANKLRTAFRVYETNDSAAKKVYFKFK